jgi:hypothetical protein
LADGGRYTDTKYAWYNPDTGSYLYHTETNGEYADPFFDEENEARESLERLAESGTKAEYENLSLHTLKMKKIGETVEVLTDQAGIHDFATDGGRPEDTHQIPNPKPERLWFWYEPASDRILQEEVKPYNVCAMFASEQDAREFINWYTEFHDVPLINFFDLYSAEIDLEGLGRRQHGGQEAEKNNNPAGPPEQADFSNFRSNQL